MLTSLPMHHLVYYQVFKDALPLASVCQPGAAQGLRLISGKKCACSSLSSCGSHSVLPCCATACHPMTRPLLPPPSSSLPSWSSPSCGVGSGQSWEPFFPCCCCDHWRLRGVCSHQSFVCQQQLSGPSQVLQCFLRHASCHLQR